VLLYTSGTTGGAKVVELTHGGLRWNAGEIASVFELTADDVVFGAVPFPHVLGQSAVMNAALLRGAAVALVTRFEPRAALDLMAATGTTVFVGVPTMCLALLDEADTRGGPRLRLAHTGGAPLDPHTRAAFEARFGCPVLEGYGMTEVGGALCTQRLDLPRKPGSVGRPIEGMEIRIDGGRGEVEVRGRSLMRGYRGEEPLAPGDWFRSGDIGYLDEDGDLFLVDRTKDVILRGGYSVYPREVEEVLLQHPDVAEAVVVGIPDARLGEEVAALVAPRGTSNPLPEELRAFVRERVAAYKYPRVVAVVPELPHGPSGKVLRRAIDRDALGHALDELERGPSP
jgi:long-chain acyl-CoA synthetase